MTNCKVLSRRSLIGSFGLNALVIVAIVVLAAGCSPEAVDEGPRLSPAEEAAKRGSERQFNEDFDGAIAAYTEAITLDAKLKGVHRNRGICYFEQGKFDEAIADLNAEILLDPDNPQGYYHRAETYDRLGDPDKAATDRADYERLSKPSG